MSAIDDMDRRREHREGILTDRRAAWFIVLIFILIGLYSLVPPHFTYFQTDRGQLVVINNWRGTVCLPEKEDCND